MKAYTTKSNALRAAKSAGFTKEQVEIVEYEGGYTFIEVVTNPEGFIMAASTETQPAGSDMLEAASEELVAAAAKVEETTQSNLPYAFESHGFTHCPHCGIHLDNGIGDHEGEVNGKHTVFTKTNEYWCMACNGEFGPAIVKVEHVAGKPDHFKVTIAHKSEAERPCKLVWIIADEMPEASRKEVIAAAVAKGVAYNTARTQYQQWFQLNKAGK